MSETAWERTKRYSGAAFDSTKRYSGVAYDKALKPGFDKAWKALDKLGAPINRLSNRVGAEAFWPTSLDKESDKAARILRSFCKDGFYQQIDDAEAKAARDGGEAPVGPQGKQRVLKKIPEGVIKRAKGLAIFTTMRTGLWVSGAGGSGVLVARNEQTGEWSPPSGILLHTAGLGFLVGVDIYDCVIVINTYKALEAFTKLRCTLGGEISAVAGPVGIGGVVDTEVHKRQAPLFTYLKSRGFYAGVQVDGTLVIERSDENEVFYGEKIGVADILAGKARTPPTEKYRLLLNTIRAAQGDLVDEKDLPSAGDKPPGDFEIQTERELLR
jgi:lipid-binding SYLF domain-containing protein